MKIDCRAGPNRGRVGPGKPLEDPVRLVTGELTKYNEVLLKAPVEGGTGLEIGLDKASLTQSVTPFSTASQKV